MRPKNRVLFFLLALAAPSLYAQANSGKIPVHLICDVESGDSIGQRLCSALRDEIAASPRYYQMQAEEKTYWLLRMVTTSLDSKNTNSAEAVELTLLRNGIEHHAALGVYVTNDSNVKSQAGRAFAATDESVQKYLEDAEGRR